MARRDGLRTWLHAVRTANYWRPRITNEHLVSVYNWYARSRLPYKDLNRGPYAQHSILTRRISTKGEFVPKPGRSRWSPSGIYVSWTCEISYVRSLLPPPASQSIQLTLDR